MKAARAKIATMRQSTLFTKTRREAPSDEVSKNAQLLIRGGYIHKEMAGVYTYLPLGLRALSNIIKIIREEIDAVGGQELAMPALQDPELWKKTGRWSDDAVDVWFKSTLKTGGDVGFGWTHEEDITNVMTHFVHSYKDLPVLAYQFQTKFRNETRAKSGIMRTREVIMKDLYSFATSEAEHARIYESVSDAYKRIFERVGIGALTYQTFASGGAFSKYSHEFQTESPAGEDLSYIHDDKKIAINKEVLTDEVLADLGVTRNELREAKSIEVGNIFSLGTRFPDALNLTFKDADGQSQPIIMGCYGIGPGRLMGTIVEALSDEKGIVWPKEVAPFSVHLVSVGTDEKVIAASEALYKKLTAQKISVLYDDRDVRAGEKFADADLLGMPYRVVVSEKTLAQTSYELSERSNGVATLVSEAELLTRIA